MNQEILQGDTGISIQEAQLGVGSWCPSCSPGTHPPASSETQPGFLTRHTEVITRARRRQVCLSTADARESWGLQDGVRY